MNEYDYPAVGASSQPSQPGFKREALLFAWETFKIVVISLAIIIPIRYYLVQPFFVKGASMEPAFLDGDYLLIDELSYRFEDPARGDVIVFRYPEDESQYFIKRIVGLPGETVKIINETVTVANTDHPKGITLDESYLDTHQETFGNMTIILESDEYFVMGDNRLHSSDSRRWGPVHRDEVIGRALFRAWPPNRVQKIPGAAY